MLFACFQAVAADEPRKGNLDEIQNKKNMLDQVQKLRNRKKNHEQQSFHLKGCIIVAGCHEGVPPFRILFNGMHGVSNREGYFSFPLDKDCKTLSLIFCKNIEPQFEKHQTLKGLGIHSGKRNQCFTLTKDEYDQWQWNEQIVLDETKSIADGTCIVLVDPKYVERLETWPVKIPGKVVQLPRIVLKGDCESKTKRASAKSLLYTLESTAYHEPIKERVKIEGNGMKRLSLQE